MLKTLKSGDWFGSDGFPISVQRREPQIDFPPHKHEFSEIVFITGGSARHVVRRESWQLSAGDVFVIGGEQSHVYREMNDLRLVNVLFQSEKLSMNIADLASLPGYHALFTLEPAWRQRHQFQSKLRLAPRDLDAVMTLVESLENELKSRAPGYGFMAHALFMRIIGLLSRHYGQSRSASARHLLRLAETITQLEMQPQTNFNLNDLAKSAGMSTRSFVRAFQAATGLPPIAYLIQLRIKQSASLLRTTVEPVTEIAFRVGFNDSNYFIRQFTKLMGCPPHRYRLRQRYGP